MYKDYVDWDTDISYGEPDKSGVSTSWTEDPSTYAPAFKSKEDFVEYLQRQKILWNTLQKILQKRYNTVHNREFNFEKLSNPKDSFLYHEGYKQALKDINKVIPRPRRS